LRPSVVVSLKNGVIRYLSLEGWGAVMVMIVW